MRKKLGRLKGRYFALIGSLSFSFGSAITLYFLISSRLVKKLSGVQSLSESTAFVLLYVASAVLSLMAFYKAVHSIANYNESGLSLSIRRKIFLALGAAATLPILFVGAFTISFLHSSLQAWFNDNIASVVEKSIVVSRVYLDENKSRLARAAEQLVCKIEAEHINALQAGKSISLVLEQELLSGSWEEAVVFHARPDVVIARAGIGFMPVSQILLRLSENNGMVPTGDVQCEEDRIQTLVKFSKYKDTYLFLSGILDRQVVDYLNKSSGAAVSYRELRETLHTLKLRFVFVNLLLVSTVLITALYAIAVLSRRITDPIMKLAQAVEVMQDGDLTSTVPVVEGGDEIATLSKAFDRMLRRIARQRRDLVVAQESLAWAQVARRVAHEINNPLTPISLSAEMLESKFLSKVPDRREFSKYTRNILRYVADIKNIVSSFSLFAKLPSPELKECELSSWLKQVVESRQGLKDGIVEYSIASSVPDEVKTYCDINQLGQVMSNLFSNAEAALTGSQVSNPKILVSLLQDQQNILIRVEDNGPGFVSEVISSGGLNCISTKPGGSGLGLAMVRRIVEEHYGSIELGGSDLGGASVEIRIPLTKSDPLKTRAE